MDIVMSNLFDNIFCGLERGCLTARKKRKDIIQYISIVIQGCCNAEACDPQTACNKAILSAIKFHESTRVNNGMVCLLGKFHNVLYVAAKICYDFKLKDSSTVVTLLNNMFECEKSFERLFCGALYGIGVSHIISGWKSDFESQEENIRAIVYFADHATKSRCQYTVDGCKISFIDVPIESVGGTTPAGVCLQFGQPDLLLILLRFGAYVNVTDDDDSRSPPYQIIRKLNDFWPNLPINLIHCLKLLLRVVPTLSRLLLEYDSSPDNKPLNYSFVAKYIPDSRSGKTTPELKHLCKLSIRSTLAHNFQLPYGIEHLPVPEEIKRYLNLEFD